MALPKTFAELEDRRHIPRGVIEAIVHDCSPARIAEVIQAAIDEILVREGLPTLAELANPALNYDENFGDDKLCSCGHSYYRHFDWMLFDTREGKRYVHCKYCPCGTFTEVN